MITYDHHQYGPQPSWTWYLATWYCLFACASAAFLCELADTGKDTLDLPLRSAPRKGLQRRCLNLALPDGKVLPLQLANEKVYFKPCRAKPAPRLTALKDSPLSETVVPGQAWRVQDLQDPQARVHLAEGRHDRFWQRELTWTHCVICNDAKPSSKAFVPCGHACVWGPCFHWMQPWDMKGRGPKHWRTVPHRSNVAIRWVDYNVGLALRAVEATCRRLQRFFAVWDHLDT